MAGSSKKTPSAVRDSLTSHDPETLIEKTSMRWTGAEWVVDDAKEPLYMHQLRRCSSISMASDREATIRSGMGIDKQGAALEASRPWYRYATHAMNTQVIATLPQHCY